jgi:hypothetical protein
VFQVRCGCVKVCLRHLSQSARAVLRILRSAGAHSSSLTNFLLHIPPSISSFAHQSIVMVFRTIPLGFVLNLLEAFLLYLPLHVSWVLFVDKPWKHQRTSDLSTLYPLTTIVRDLDTPEGSNLFQPVSEGLVSHVSPWAVEYLPNPVIFSAVYAVYAGYNVIRARPEFRSQSRNGPNGSPRPDSREERVVVDIPCQKCVSCDQVFRTKGLLTSVFLTQWRLYKLELT